MRFIYVVSGGYPKILLDAELTVSAINFPLMHITRTSQYVILACDSLAKCRHVWCCLFNPSPPFILSNLSGQRDPNAAQSFPLVYLEEVDTSALRPTGMDFFRG
jgi:hypothetical protein